MSDLLEVGDILVTKTAFGSNKFRITRVTKLYAFSKRPDDGYEHKFRREISCDMAVPRERFSMVNYSVIKCPPADD